MPQYWMIITSPENFDIDRQINFELQGFKKRVRKTVGQVKPDDKFVIYINRSQRIGATVVATSNPYYDDRNKVWIEEDELWPCRFKTRPQLVLAEDELLDVKTLVPSLTFVTPKQKAATWGLAFQGSLRRIPKEDFLLIESEMRKIKARTSALSTVIEGLPPLTDEQAKQAIMELHLEKASLHDRIGEMLEAVGSKMGYNAFTRYRIAPEHAYELDVAWLQGKNPEVAVEIQIGGDIIAAKERLAEAKKFNYRKLIMVIEEEQLKRLNDILRFDELRHWLDAWSISAVYKLYTAWASFFDLYQRLTDSRYKERTEVEFIRA